jgi:hypothetical protein
MLVYGFPQIAYRLWYLTMMTRRLCCLPSYRPQPTACLVDLLSVLRRRVSTYPLTFPPDGPPVNPTYVAPSPLTIEQIRQSLYHIDVFDVAVLLPCVPCLPLLLLLYLYYLGRFSFSYLFFLLLCSLLSLALLLFSLIGYVPRLLLGCLTVSARGDVLQSCSFSLAFSLHHLHTNPLPALSTTHVAKLLACTATRPCAIAIHVSI